MIDRSRELELSLGDGNKKIEKNELETVVLQRRCIRASKRLKKNDIISRSDLVILRPCPKNAIDPKNIEKIVGKKLVNNIPEHEIIKWEDIN